VPVDGAASPLRDSYRLSGGAGAGKPTIHGFTGRGTDRIDYILVEPPLRALHFEVLDQPVDGQRVSDHFPVLAALEL
jgi:endonuclease/exonuclease/phosphatase family metal-dependent hydrolase